MTTPIQFQDIAAVRHVNNREYPNFLAEARAGYHEEVLNYDLRPADKVGVHMISDYYSEVTRRDTVEIGVSVINLGTTSFTMEYMLGMDDEIVSTVETVQDNKSGLSCQIPADWRRCIEDHEGIISA